MAVSLLVGQEVATHGPAESAFARGVAGHLDGFDAHAVLAIGGGGSALGTAESPDGDERFAVRCDLPATPLSLWSHLAAKLVLNTVSTASMGLLGRLTSNWMIYVNTSNKKLIDRGVRLIADQTAVDYDRACHELFVTLGQPDAEHLVDGRASSPVAVTIERIRAGGG